LSSTLTEIETTVMSLIPGVRDESRDWFAWKNTTTHNYPLS
jgi:hypothetical protein